MYNITPHTIDKNQLPPTPREKLWRAYRTGVRSHFFAKQLKKHSVRREIDDVVLIYGNRTALAVCTAPEVKEKIKGLGEVDQFVFLSSFNKKTFYVLTDGLPQEAKDTLINSMPADWVKVSGPVDHITFKIARFVILPKVTDYTKLTGEEKAKLPIPDVKVAIVFFMEGYRYIFPRNILEKQAMITALPGWNEYYIEGSSGAETSWKYNEGKHGIYNWLPKVKISDPNKFDFHPIDLLIHPFRSLRAFFKGAHEALKAYRNLKGET
jgi:hypothetical protein